MSMVIGSTAAPVAYAQPTAYGQPQPAIGGFGGMQSFGQQPFGQQAFGGFGGMQSFGQQPFGGFGGLPQQGSFVAPGFGGFGGFGQQPTYGAPTTTYAQPSYAQAAAPAQVVGSLTAPVTLSGGGTPIGSLTAPVQAAPAPVRSYAQPASYGQPYGQSFGFGGYAQPTTFGASQPATTISQPTSYAQPMTTMSQPMTTMSQPMTSFASQPQFASYGQPYGQPSYGQPSYGQPTYSSYGQPSYGQPTRVIQQAPGSGLAPVGTTSPLA